MDFSKKTLSAAPKARVCYICGRQYMVHSFEIHIKQCKELFLAREELKDPRERKKLPEDPLEKMLAAKANGGFEATSDRPSTSGGGGSGRGRGGDGAGDGGDGISLDELNKLANDTYNNETLSTCAHCGRTFLPEKLATHNKSCTADNPARKVKDSVRRGNPVPAITESGGGSLPTITRPHTSAGITSRSSLRDPAARRTADVQKSVNFPAEADEGEEGGEEESVPSLRIDNGAMVGHMGGPAGRNIRKAKTKPPSSAPIPADFASKEEAIAFLTNKLSGLEDTASELINSIAEVKSVLAIIAQLP